MGVLGPQMMDDFIFDLCNSRHANVLLNDPKSSDGDW